MKTERSQEKVRRRKKTGVLDIAPWPWFSSNKFKLILTSSEINDTSDDEDTDEEPGTSSSSKRVRKNEGKKRKKKRKRNKKTDTKTSGQKSKPEKGPEMEEETVTDMISVKLNPKPSYHTLTNYLSSFRFLVWWLKLPKKIEPPQTDSTRLFISDSGPWRIFYSFDCAVHYKIYWWGHIAR